MFLELTFSSERFSHFYGVQSLCQLFWDFEEKFQPVRVCLNPSIFLMSCISLGIKILESPRSIFFLAGPFLFWSDCRYERQLAFFFERQGKTPPLFFFFHSPFPPTRSALVFLRSTLHPLAFAIKIFPESFRFLRIFTLAPPNSPEVTSGRFHPLPLFSTSTFSEYPWVSKEGDSPLFFPVYKEKVNPVSPFFLPPWGKSTEYPCVPKIVSWLTAFFSCDRFFSPLTVVWLLFPSVYATTQARKKW